MHVSKFLSSFHVMSSLIAVSGISLTANIIESFQCTTICCGTNSTSIIIASRSRRSPVRLRSSEMNALS